MKKLLIVFLVLILLVCVGVGVVYFKFFYTPPLNEAERASLTPDWDRATGGNWSPWYEFDDGTREWNPTKSFNAWLATYPEEDKAWPILIDARLEFDDVLEDKRYEEFNGTLPSDLERWAILQPILESERVQELSKVFQEALSKPILGCEMLDTDDPHSIDAMKRYGIEVDAFHVRNENPPLIQSLLPSLGVCRDSSFLLTSQAALSLLNNDPDSFVDQLISVSQGAQLCNESPTLIGELVSVACNSLINQTISWALQTHPDRLEAKHLQQLKGISAISTSPTKAFYGELLMFHDTMRRLVSPEGKLTLESIRKVGEFDNNPGSVLSDPVHMPLQELGGSAQRALLFYKESIDLSIQESIPQPNLEWDFIFNPDEFIEHLERETGLYPTLLIGIMMPATYKATTRFNYDTQEMIGIDLALSLHLHKLRHGAFPSTLQDLDPDLLTIEPIDVFTGESLHYTLTESGPLIYSVGDDRDDDGGKTRWEINDAGPDDNIVEIRSPLTPEWIRPQDLQQRLADDPDFIDGDWVLFPIPIEDPAPLDEWEQEIINGS